jgi:hypothetical protein
MSGAKFVSKLDLSSRVAWLSISKGCENKGNLIIEHALKKLLKLKRIAVSPSAFSGLTPATISRVNSCRVLLLPGCTLLDPGEYPALDALGRISCNKLAIGVAFCSRDGKVDLSVARGIDLPIGSRDPFTHRRLRAARIRSEFVGCPTLFLGRASTWKHNAGPLVISLGPGPQRQIQECVKACARLTDVMLVEHVPRLQPTFPLPEGVRRVAISDAAQAIELYATAGTVLTGRLHAFLTCIALGTPVIFFGSWTDSRFSLLGYLGVKQEQPEPRRIVKLAEASLNGKSPPMRCLERAERLRKAMLDFLASFEIEANSACS